MLRLLRLTVCALLAFIPLSLRALPASSQAPRTEIVYGLTLQPSGFDPHIHASSELGIPLRQVYDTLVYRDPVSRAFVPGLATSWQISDDGLTYTFALRRDVVFHDGTPFNASAVGVNLDRIMNPATGSQKARFMLGTYSGYDLVDDYTIRLNLAVAYSPMLDTLSQVYLGIASPTALAAYSNERYQFHQVGTGPYRFVEYVPGDRLVLRRNDDYAWSPPFYTLPVDQRIEQITFRFFTEPLTRALALESGEVQIMGELPPLDARSLSATGRAQLLPTTIPGQPLQFLFNTTRFPTSDLNIRRALLFATSREAIIDTVFQRLSPIAWSPLSTTTQYYNAELVGAYAYDPARARALLDAARLTDSDNDGFLDVNGEPVTVTLLSPTWGSIPEVAQLLQDQWRDIGIRTIIEIVPTRAALFARVDSGDYSAAAWYDFGVDPAYLDRYYSTSGDLNWTGYSSPDLDNLLRQAGVETNDAARQALYGQAQRIIVEQALLLPIRDYVNLNASTTGIEGLTFDAYGWFPLLPNVRLRG